jgi:cell division protein FtsZ
MLTIFFFERLPAGAAALPLPLLFFGASIDETAGDTIKVTVIATGFDLDSIEVVEAPAEIMVPQAASELARRSARTRSDHLSALGSTVPPSSQRSYSLREQHQTAVRHERPSDIAYTSRRQFGEPPQTSRSHLQRNQSGYSQPPPRSQPIERIERHDAPRDEVDWDTPAYQRRGH